MFKKVNDMTLFVQAILGITALILALMTTFIPKFIIPTEVILAFLMFITAYNNYRLYSRKGATIVYIVAGIISIVLLILGIFFGV